MSEQELIYTMALTLAMRQQSKYQQILVNELGSATQVYENQRELSEMTQRFSPHLCEAIANLDSYLSRCEKELSYTQEHNIRILSWHDDPNYPARLRTCDDAPLLLYALGPIDFNKPRVVSVVGTRHCTERGRDLCEQLARGLAEQCPGTLVVSGLAYGIDISAHRAALWSGLPTVGVLAHGLDEIYPRLHRQTAVEMLKDGGLLTEFMSETKIDKLNFLQRNRIVAGIADATIVVESPVRGGSLNTARLAMDYSREVFAFPGRPSDKASEGCNLLIRKNGAALITSINDVIMDLGWEVSVPKEPAQAELFPMLEGVPLAIVTALKNAEADLSLADLSSALGMPSHQLLSHLISMEMEGWVKTLPGARYHLLRS